MNAYIPEAWLTASCASASASTVFANVLAPLGSATTPAIARSQSAIALSQALASDPGVRVSNEMMPLMPVLLGSGW